MNDVFFSVIIPVYNVKPYLADCLDSVLTQNYQNFEIIIINDGSTDGSDKICDSYALKNNKIKVIHQQNKGSLFARKTGIENSTGDYCVFLDSDDTLKENALFVLNKSIKETDCDCIIFGMDRVSGSKTVLAFQPEFSENTIICDKKELYLTLFCGESFNSICRKSVRKSIFHGFDYSPYYSNIMYGEDRLQTVEIAKNASSILFLTDSLYNYRMHDKSITHKEFDANFRQNYDLSKYVYDFLKKENVFSKKDFSYYFGQYFKTIIKWIKLISKSSCSLKEKCISIKSYKCDDFYKVIIKSKPCIKDLTLTDKLLFILFRLGMYRTIVKLCNIKK